jgi:hypothetical protein
VGSFCNTLTRNFRVFAFPMGFQLAHRRSLLHSNADSFSDAANFLSALGSVVVKMKKSSS